MIYLANELPTIHNLASPTQTTCLPQENYYELPKNYENLPRKLYYENELPRHNEKKERYLFTIIITFIYTKILFIYTKIIFIYNLHTITIYNSIYLYKLQLQLFTITHTKSIKLFTNEDRRITKMNNEEIIYTIYTKNFNIHETKKKEDKLEESIYTIYTNLKSIVNCFVTKPINFKLNLSYLLHFNNMVRNTTIARQVPKCIHKLDGKQIIIRTVQTHCRLPRELATKGTHYTLYFRLDHIGTRGPALIHFPSLNRYPQSSIWCPTSTPSKTQQPTRSATASTTRCLQRSSSPSRRPPASTYRLVKTCLLYTSPSPRDRQKSRMPSSA